MIEWRSIKQFSLQQQCNLIRRHISLSVMPNVLYVHLPMVNCSSVACDRSPFTSSPVCTQETVIKKPIGQHVSDNMPSANIKNSEKYQHPIRRKTDRHTPRLSCFPGTPAALVSPPLYPATILSWDSTSASQRMLTKIDLSLHVCEWLSRPGLAGNDTDTVSVSERKDTSSQPPVTVTHTRHLQHVTVPQSQAPTGQVVVYTVYTVIYQHSAIRGHIQDVCTDYRAPLKLISKAFCSPYVQWQPQH